MKCALDLSRRILFSGQGAVALDKPAGLPSTGRDLDDPNCLQFLLGAHLRKRVWAVHQLDAETSGVNVFVLKKSLVAFWSRRMQPPRGCKRYLALCRGVPAFDSRWIEEPIGTLDEQGRRRGITASGQKARTFVEVLERGEAHAFIALRLETGRSHQIRIHLAHIGHPLVGEKLYCKPPCALHSRHALHAESVAFADGKEPTIIAAPPPEDLLALAARLGLRWG